MKILKRVLLVLISIMVIISSMLFKGIFEIVGLDLNKILVLISIMILFYITLSFHNGNYTIPVMIYEMFVIIPIYISILLIPETYLIFKKSNFAIPLFSMMGILLISTNFNFRTMSIKSLKSKTLIRVYVASILPYTKIVICFLYFVIGWHLA